MDWTDLMTQVAAGAVLGAVGWVVHALRGIARRIARLEASCDERLDRAERRLVRVESVDAGGALARLGDAETRIAKLEAAQITHQDLGKVYRRLDTVVETVSEMKGTMSATQGQLAVICEHLMERGSK